MFGSGNVGGIGIGNVDSINGGLGSDGFGGDVFNGSCGIDGNFG